MFIISGSSQSNAPQAVPSQAVPSQAVPSQAVPSQAVPSQTDSTQADPTQADPTQAAFSGQSQVQAHRAPKGQVGTVKARRACAATPFLTIRKGIYQFVRRWPTDLLAAGLVKQTFMRRSLRTSSLVDAQVMARRLAVDFDKRVASLRQKLGSGRIHSSSAPANMVRVCDIATLASRFEADVLHGDDCDRSQALDADEFNTYVEDIEAELKQVRRLYAQGLHGQHDEVVQGYVQAEGLVMPADPTVLQELQRQMLQAQLRALRTLAARLDGDVRQTPASPPPAIRSEFDVDDLEVAVEHWREHTKPQSKTLHEVRSIMRRLMQYTGKSRFSTLTQADMMAFRKAETSRKGRAGKAVAPQTVNKGLTLLRAVAKLAFDDALEARGLNNPFAKLRKAVVKPSDETMSLGLSSEELQAIFSGPVHRSGQRSVSGAGEACFWMPLLAYSCGARMSELAQLRVANVLERDGVPCIFISCSRDEGAAVVDLQTLGEHERERVIAQSLKTAKSNRLIPVHPRLLELGFMDYVAWVRAQGCVQLFPAIVPDCHGVAGGNFSKYWSRYLKTVGVKRPGLDWRSFRHTFKTAARNVHIDTDICDYIQGHQENRVSQTYGQFQPGTVLHALSKIGLPAVADLPRWTPPTTKGVR